MVISSGVFICFMFWCSAQGSELKQLSCVFFVMTYFEIYLTKSWAQSKTNGNYIFQAPAWSNPPKRLKEKHPK